MMVRATTVAAALMSFVASAQQEISSSVNRQQRVTEMVNAFARCVGIYEAASDLYKARREPATAEEMHNLANGAATAAMYLLGQESMVNGNPPRPYGEFMPYVEGLAEASKATMRALIERGETEAFSKHFQDCSAIAEAQETVIQALRNEAIGR